MGEEEKQEFAERLVAWQIRFGRHGLPWMTEDPYRRWLSEVMLQQTQVSVVVEYFERFLKAFPSVQALSAASEEDVMRLWAGLGYYSRARNLHACAKRVVAEHAGAFPRSVEQLERLPGIGRSTAGAIASFCFQIPAPILDGNVRRVFARLVCLPEPVDSAKAVKMLWAMAEECVSRREPGIYNQALMDLGAMVCTRSSPHCEKCPVRSFCKAHEQGQTDRYPVPKVKKPLPLIERSMILYRVGDRVLLVHREGKGVWRGLWSLPEADEIPPNAQMVGEFSHRFTHYALHARVFSVPVGRRTAPEIPDGRWVSRQEMQTEAIPTPVRRFLLPLG